MLTVPIAAEAVSSGRTAKLAVPRLRSNEVIGAQNNQSRETVRRFIRLTNLIPELLDMFTAFSRPQI